MFNIHRNFFVDNILKDLKIIPNNQINKLPYKDNITLFNNNYASLYFVDIDRIKDLKILKNDIKTINSKKKFSLFLLISKKKLKLFNFEKKLTKNNINNISIINIFKIGIKNPVDKKREKILHTYLSLETQLAITAIVKKIIWWSLNFNCRHIIFYLY